MPRKLYNIIMVFVVLGGLLGAIVLRIAADSVQNQRIANSWISIIIYVAVFYSGFIAVRKFNLKTSQGAWLAAVATFLYLVSGLVFHNLLIYFIWPISFPPQHFPPGTDVVTFGVLDILSIFGFFSASIGATLIFGSVQIVVNAIVASIGGWVAKKAGSKSGK